MTGGPRRRPTKTETRSRLLEAAADVFAERGFEAASLDDVARAAGLTKGAVYSSFAGKDDLILTLMEERIAARIGLAVQALEGDDGHALAADAGAALTAAAAGDEQWQRLFIGYWLRALRRPDAREHLVARRREQRRRIAAAIDRALAERGVRSAVGGDEAAIAVLALSNGIAIEALLDPGSVPPDLFGRLLGGLVDEA